MRAFRLSVYKNSIEPIEFNSEEDIPKLLKCEKIVCSNYYLGNYKYMVYSDPEDESQLTLITKKGFNMYGDLIIVPQLGELHDFDYAAIESAKGEAYTINGCQLVLFGRLAEN